LRQIILHRDPRKPELSAREPRKSTVDRAGSAVGVRSARSHQARLLQQHLARPSKPESDEHDHGACDGDENANRPIHSGFPLSPIARLDGVERMAFRRVRGQGLKIGPPTPA
jgi:hypothetical protein